MWNPRIAKAFNALEALKASPSKLAGHLSENWNTYVNWASGFSSH
jgi:hypothetical protein